MRLKKSSEGDEIEVDADKGIIRNITKGEEYSYKTDSSFYAGTNFCRRFDRMDKEADKGFVAAYLKLSLREL